DGGHDPGDAAHLRGQVAGHRVDVVGQIFPHAGDAFDLRLAAQLALGADVARHARDLGHDRRSPSKHGVNRVVELEDLALDVDGDLAGEVAARDGRRDVGNVAHLRGQIAAHEVDAVGQVLPGSGDAFDQRLAAQLALGADFARHARDLG